MKIKKFSLVFILMLGIIFLTGCGSETKKESNVEGTLDEIMTKVYSKVSEEDLPKLMKIEVTSENVQGFLGTSEIEYEEALASEPMISSIAHSVVLVRTKNGANVEDIKKQLKENVNPRKWVCVGVENDEVIIDSKGNLIIIIVVQDEELRSSIYEGFKNL